MSQTKKNVSKKKQTNKNTKKNVQTNNNATKKVVEIEKTEVSAKKLNIIGIIIVVVLILLSVGGYFLYNYIEDSKIDGWGKTYYAYLKKAKKKPESASLPKDMDDAKLKFIELKADEDPAMVVTYKKKKKQYTNLYFIEENVVNTLVFEENTTIEFLYNIEKNSYDYYAHTEDKENDYYDSVTSELESAKEQEKKEEDKEPEYTFPKEEVEDGELSAFDEKFITPDIDDDYVDFDTDLSNRELRKRVEKSRDKHKPKKELVSSQEDAVVRNRKEEIETIVKEKRVHELFTKLQGVWYYPKENVFIQFYNQKNKKYFLYGLYATEFGEECPIENTDAKGNIFMFTCNGAEFEFDTTNADNKKITYGGDTYLFMHKDLNKAYDVIIDKYFG